MTRAHSGLPSRGPIGFFLVVAALLLSLAIQASLAAAQRPAAILFLAGSVAAGFAGALGWRRWRATEAAAVADANHARVK